MKRRTTSARAFEQIIARDNGDLLVHSMSFSMKSNNKLRLLFLRDLHETEGENGGIDAAGLERREPSRGAADLGDADIGFRVQAKLRQS